MNCAGRGEESLEGFLQPGYVIGLWAFGSLNDVEFDFVTFFKTFVAFELDGTVMHEDIGSVIAAEEAVSFCVIEPFNGAFVLCHVTLLLP